MPRRHRAARERARPLDLRPPRPVAPEWAHVDGVEVLAVGPGDKEYRCPGCDHEVRAGMPHLVIVPDDEPDARRHWHTECWRRELRRSR